MDSASLAWQALMQRYAAACREERPIPARETLSAEDEWRCQIIGGSFYAWMDQELPVILRQRAAVRPPSAAIETPLIVMTTEMPGLVAAAELLRLPAAEIVCLLEEEYRQWLPSHDDPDFTDHLHYWNYFVDTEPSLKDELGFDARLHIIGCLFGRSAGAQTTHLWQWDGAQMLLKEEGYTRVVY